ncbi:hypothetical protein B0H10DRAFT_2193625, partial [Mycena sp. CBHHK59/15]
MFVFEPTNAKPPTPVTQFGNCQILPLAFMFCFAIFADPWGHGNAYLQLRDDGMAATVVWHIFANSDAGSSAGDSSGHFWVHCDRNNGYVAFVPKIDSVPGYPAPLNSLGLSAEALRANRAVLKMRKGLLSYTSREFRDKCFFLGSYSNPYLQLFLKVLVLETLPFAPNRMLLEPMQVQPCRIPTPQIPNNAGPAHLTLSHRDLRTRPDPASPVNRSTCRQIRSQVIKMFLSKGSEYSGTTCLENRTIAMQPFNILLGFNRMRTSLVMYECTSICRASSRYRMALIWGIYSAFGRVRRRIDWTNAHAPSTQYVVVLERLMSLETGLT